MANSLAHCSIVGAAAIGKLSLKPTRSIGSKKGVTWAGALSKVSRRSSRVTMTISPGPQTFSTDTAISTDNTSPDLPPESVIKEATRFGVSFPKTLFEFSGKPGWGKRGDPWQHHFGLPTAPGPNHAATYPQYDVTLNNISFHKSFGHLFATLNFLIPTVLFWNDPTRQSIVLLLAFCTAQTAFEHIFHIVTNQIHFVHMWKQIPILGAGAIALYYGAWGAAQAGPRDLLFYEWWYFLTVFVGGTIFEGFVTHFGKFWPVKAPGSI